MKKTKKSFGAVVIGIIAIGIFAGGVWGIYTTIGLVTQAKKQTTFTPGNETNTAIENLKSEIDATAKYELAHGCVKENEFGRSEFCGKSKERMDALNNKLTKAVRKHEVRSAEEVAVVVKNIRNVAELPSLNVSFEARVSNPYTEKIKKDVEYYRDNKGTVYVVDPTTNKVVSFTRNDRFKTAVNKKLTLEKLRMIAEKYFTKHIKDFEQVKREYKYEEGSKGDMYMFRYNARQKVNAEEMLPFVQVKLSAGGELVGFSDIRSLYQK